MTVQNLSASTNDYDDLLREHRRYEDRLEELGTKSWLTPDEELEEKRLKKLKLQIKDRLANHAPQS